MVSVSKRNDGRFSGVKGVFEDSGGSVESAMDPVSGKTVRGRIIPHLGYWRLNGYGCLFDINSGGIRLEPLLFQGKTVGRDSFARKKYLSTNM